MTEGVREEGAEKDIFIYEETNKSGNEKKTEDIRGLHPSSNTIRVIQSKRKRWVEHVAGT
jgi:hypothetical protein